MKQKRVLAVHDLSCVGRCSLTVALPILSAAGLEASALPTAVLSTHTGGFTGMTFRDLTQDLPAIFAHWKTLDLAFDAIYTGYLGSAEQVALVEQLFDAFRGEQTKIIVDPVMGDHGKLYPGMSEKMPQLMKTLCQKADVIVPNQTEAALMLGRPYLETPDKAEVDDLMQALREMTQASVVLTGISPEEGKLGAAVYDRETGQTACPAAPHMPGSYHGTGDVYASALTGAYLAGKTLVQAAQIAADFTQQSIVETLPLGLETRYGVCFERALPQLLRALES
ncbi:MAG: pyridoxamine kinase [Clostridiales bacterium]|nr:pyridoxamine kinase [Clostridiales bacterium]